MEKLQVYRLILPTETYVNQSFSIKKDCSESIRLEELQFQMYQDCDIPIDYTFHKEQYGFLLSDSEIADFIQHRIIWKIFIESSEPYCLVVESNVTAHLSFSHVVSAISNMPNDWDMFFPYDTFQYIKELNGIGMRLLNPNLREDVICEPYYLRQKWGNSIYILSKSGAKKLLGINCIKDRLDNELVHMAISDRLNLYYDEVDWFHYSQIDWKEWPERSCNIWNVILANSSWTKERKVCVRTLLRLISTIGQKLNIKLILQGGSHLGYIQHGEIMLWDDDVDIGIEETSLEAFIKEVVKHEHMEICEVLEKRTNVTYYKIWDKNGEKIDGYEYTFPFVDLWPFKKEGNDLVFKNGIICPNTAKYELTKVEFEGSCFYIPANSIEVLDSRYTSWKRKIIVYGWSHRLEKNCFPCLLVHILTNEKGRLISLL